MSSRSKNLSAKGSLLGLLAVLTLAFGSSAVNSCAAQSDMELATYYYNNGSYAQARLYFDKLWKRDKSAATYEMYINTLLELEAYSEAEKIVKGRLRTRKDQAMAQIDLGDLFLRIGEHEKADQAFDKALEHLATGRAAAKRIAEAFIQLDQLDRALEVYRLAISTDKSGYGYHYELANLQGLRGDHDGMIEAFLELLHVKPNYLRTVQNSFNRNLRVTTDPVQAEVVRVKVLRAAQRYPEDAVFSELLIWYFSQARDFNAAMTQAIGLDRRKNEDGKRLMTLSATARKNSDLATAVKGYEAVVKKGAACRYHHAARRSLLEVHLEAVTGKLPLDTAEARVLDGRYAEGIANFAGNPEAALLMRDRAHLLAFYLDDAPAALAILDAAIAFPGVASETRSEIKLEQGDVLVFLDDVWSASLLFSQVDLDHKEGVLGQKAKFRNARISYFTGDFNWAQAQLDILKASTSKLISNDAIDLSLLITDNFNMDTVTAPMEQFARADLLHYRNKLDDCLLTLDSLSAHWPGHVLEDEMLMMRAEIAVRRGQFETAATHYNDVIDLHFDDVHADNALFELANITHHNLGLEAEAQVLYERLLVEYPGSLFAVEARKRFRALRGDDWAE
jgi:tetratricopeptide (TPR) repeat protein